MKTSTMIVAAASLVLSAGYAQAQGQQQSDQQNQQTQYSNSGQQQNQPSLASPQQMPQSQTQTYSPPAQDSSGQSSGNMSQGTSEESSQSGMQQNQESDTQQQSTAQSSSDQTQNETVENKLQPQTENGITYLCGGVGEEQASYMKQQKKDYDLALTFATRNGDYLADVDVAIKDAKGKQVLNTTCGGPMMLVNLPRSGTYRVQAQASDYALHKTVKVKAKSHARAVAMIWPRDPAEMQGIASTGSNQQAGSSGSSENGASSGNSETPAKSGKIKHRRKSHKKPEKQ